MQAPIKQDHFGRTKWNLTQPELVLYLLWKAKKQVKLADLDEQMVSEFGLPVRKSNLVNYLTLLMGRQLVKSPARGLYVHVDFYQPLPPLRKIATVDRSKKAPPSIFD